jgi:hypothetical protein
MDQRTRKKIEHDLTNLATNTYTPAVRAAAAQALATLYVGDMVARLTSSTGEMWTPSEGYAGSD